jgi:2-(1,2-epoxy-1,2-dihydrophenyl)acetyl-CoA isomerase
MKDENLVLTDVDGEVVTITLNRPGVLNALDHPTALALHRAIESAAAVAGARAVVLRGAGRSFCGGGDVAAMHAHRADLPAFIDKMIDAFHASVMALNRLHLPVIASVHGAVAGGGISLAFACDLVLAARGTRFVAAYPHLGAPADGGLSFRLTQCIGAVRAFEALTLNGAIDADEALRLRLVNRVVDADAADAEAQRWARQLAALPRQSVEELKQLVAVQSRDALEAQLGREKAAFLRCAATADFKARVAAFAQRIAQRKDAP